jgi:GntR family transcriptional regulator
MHMFDIQPSSATPIYRQLIEQVQRLVAGGQLKAGDELPSVRSLAERHALEAQGLLTRRRGVGMVVAEQATATRAASERIALLEPALHAAALQAQQLGVKPEQAIKAFEKTLRDLDSGAPRHD